MNERFQFWTNPGSWPDDAYGYVFLARALLRVGRAMYPHEWTDSEPFAPPPIETKQDIIARSRSGAEYGRGVENFLREISKLIASNDVSKLSWEVESYRVLTPLRTARSLPGTADNGLRTRQVLSAEAVRYGESLVPEENQRRAKAKERWERVVSIVKGALRDGNLECVTLPTHGGAFSSIRPKEWWNVPGIESRLTMCRLNPEDPFSAGFAGRGYAHIFVSGNSLSQILPPPPKPKTAKEIKGKEDAAALIYDRLHTEINGNVSRDAHEEACKAEGISSTISRLVWERKKVGAFH